uniref:(northern house mosquito) hypothetical protein n=1 Tax=Culex pipiens TaxID=7175 RepID=A0A8D8G5N4_CULPI
MTSQNHEFRNIHDKRTNRFRRNFSTSWQRRPKFAKRCKYSRHFAQGKQSQQAGVNNAQLLSEKNNAAHFRPSPVAPRLSRIFPHKPSRPTTMALFPAPLFLPCAGSSYLLTPLRTHRNHTPRPAKKIPPGV